MKYRHELKHGITYCDMLVLKKRLSAVARRDEHGENGKYLVRSLYFDSLDDKALRQKLDGVNYREKFRIRFYDNDTSFIRLEKKSKLNGLCLKESCPLTETEAFSIAKGDVGDIETKGRPLLSEFFFKMKTEGLCPRAIVDYEREAFTYPAGNVRVTLDYAIRRGFDADRFLDPDCITVPTGDDIILEVKWDDFLPDIIRDAVQLGSCRSGAFSKYAVSRINIGGKQNDF